MNILIIEDEKNLAAEMAEFLTKENYLCEIALTGQDASEKIAVNLYDFVLLDLGLPDYDGLDLLLEAQNLDEKPGIIIITARGALEDKVKGLDLGADDYLAKPFSLVELHARIQAVARRKFNISNPEIHAGEFKVNIQSRRIFYNDQDIELTKKEFDLLLYLIMNKNKTLTRIQLYEHIWGNLLDDQYDSNFIDVHIKNIRKKLSAHASVDWITTVRGIGYKAEL
ncbi:MAG: response regulator transcription factor [Bacteroidales bacterium]